MNIKNARLKYCYIVFAIFIVLVSSLILSSCKEEEKLYQDVTLVVYHSETGEEIEENKKHKFEYDGNPKVFTARVKLDETGKFLGDKEFENNDWKSHIKLLIMYEGEAAYKDYNENGKLDWQKERDWPTERGVYRIELKFNNHGWFEDVEDSPKYVKRWFHFTIEIV